MGKIVIKNEQKGISFDLKASNGQILVSSKNYTTRHACNNAIEGICKYAPKAEIREPERNKEIKNPRFEIFTSDTGAYRFRLTSVNGHIIAWSNEYTTIQGCINGIKNVKRNTLNQLIVIEQ